MIDNSFRKILPVYTKWLIRIYSALRLTPNAITVLALCFACCSAYALSYSQFFLALGLWWFGRLLDGTDGIFARATQQSSDFGAYLDIVCDMASYSIMIFGFSLAFPEFYFSWMLVLFLYVLCITSALSLGSLEIKNQLSTQDNRGLRLGAGLAEGGETGIAYTLFMMFPSQLGWMIPTWIAILIITVIARTILVHKTFCKK